MFSAIPIPGFWVFIDLFLYKLILSIIAQDIIS